MTHSPIGRSAEPGRALIQPGYAQRARAAVRLRNIEEWQRIESGDGIEIRQVDYDLPRRSSVLGS